MQDPWGSRRGREDRSNSNPKIDPEIDPAASRALQLTDFNQLGALFANWRGRFEQLSRGRFSATLQVVCGETLRAIAIEANQSVLIRGGDAADLISVYPVTSDNAASTWYGHRLDPGHVVVQTRDSERDHCSSRRTSVQGLSIHRESLEEATRVLLNRDNIAPVRDRTVLRPPPAATEELRRTLAELLANPGIAPSRLEQACTAAVVETLFSASTKRPRLSLPLRSQLLRRAEEFMRSRQEQPIGVIELCRELGSSDRTLRLAFRERYGLGPMAYDKCLRLNAVRSSLQANPSLAIADVARQFGFHHLGNFAGDYCRLFGELPSATGRWR